MAEPTAIGEATRDWAAMCAEASAKSQAAGADRKVPEVDPDAWKRRIIDEYGSVEEWEAQRKRDAQWNRYGDQIPSRFRDAHPDDLNDNLRDLHDRWVDGGMTSNVLLLGNVGVGKTHAAVAMLRTAASEGMSIRFAPVVELLDQLRPGSPGSGDIERALKPDVLVLDDLGGEKPTDWTAERLYAVVNRRWLEQRPTIATSNIDADDLEATIGSRTWSRLYHGALRLKLAGDDRRKAA